MVIIYTDGACSGNPGVGGWGAVIIDNTSKPIFLNGGEHNTTNNRMELSAAINAINYCETKKDLEIFTDSKYVKDGIESWIKKWKINGWKTTSKKPVKNQDLWIKLDQEITKHNMGKHTWTQLHSPSD